MRLQKAALILIAIGPLTGQSRETVEVYVNERDASSQLLGPGKPLASSIFRQIGVRLDWRTGDLPAGKAAIGVRTEEHAPESATGEALAASELTGSSGVRINVYKDRLLRFLDTHRSLTTVAAGYVLAHELAHAMQGEPRHSVSGIMKAHWDEADFQEMFFHKLGFTVQDVDLIHRGLTLRLARNSHRMLR